MRRIALVAPALPPATAEWVERLAEASVRRAGTLASLPLEELDLVWLHGAAAFTEAGPEELRQWLARGGRLLATGEAAAAAAWLGLGDDPPSIEHPAGAGVALAAFGDHPLFAGAGAWVPLEAPAVRAPVRAWRGAGEPARTVALLASRAGADPDAVAIREIAVGEGGVLCAIGALADGPRAGPGIRQLLHNALLGDGVPHRDRAVAAVWPRPGRAVAREAALPLPRFPDLGEAPPTPGGAESAKGAVDAAAPRGEGGRRVQVTGSVASPDGWWMDGLRFLSAPRVFVEGLAAEPRETRLLADRAEQRYVAGDAEVRLRRFTALEMPALVWELAAAEGTRVALDWMGELRGTWPLVGGALGDLVYNVNESGRRLWLGARGTPAQLAVEVAGGRITVVEPADGDGGPAVRVTCEGGHALRLVFVPASDAADLERTFTWLARRGLAGLTAQRSQHRRLLAEYGIAAECPEPGLAAALDAAKVALDAALADVPGLGRGVAAASPPAPVPFADAAGAAEALLASGHREAARGLVRLVAQAGLAPEAIGLRGHLVPGGEGAQARLRALAARYAAWTGDAETLERVRPGLERAAGTTLDEILATAPAAPFELPASAEWRATAAAVARVVGELWAVAPDALRATISLRLALPAAWDRVALRRLRVGASVLDLAARRRFGRVSVDVQRAFGPPVTLSLTVTAGAAPSLVTVDDVELGGGRAQFQVTEHHRVEFDW